MPLLVSLLILLLPVLFAHRTSALPPYLYLHPQPHFQPPANATSALPPSSLDAVSGINCRGSFYCTIYAGTVVFTAYRIATEGLHPVPDWELGPLNNSALYAPPHHVLCLPTDPSLRGGFCVFAQRGGDDGKPYISGTEVRRGLGLLDDHGCRMCGSVPLEGGGLLTVNYVSGRVCPGICPEARYE